MTWTAAAKIIVKQNTGKRCWYIWLLMVDSMVDSNGCWSVITICLCWWKISNVLGLMMVDSIFAYYMVNNAWEPRVTATVYFWSKDKQMIKLITALLWGSESVNRKDLAFNLANRKRGANGRTFACKWYWQNMIIATGEPRLLVQHISSQLYNPAKLS